MKNLFTLLFAFSFITISAQNDGLEMSPEKVSYTKVVEVEGLNKDQLFVKAREWFLDSFKDSEEVIQIEDREGGMIAGKGYSEFMSSGDVALTLMGADGGSGTQLHYTIKTYFKDGRTKIEVTNMTVHKLTYGRPDKGVGIENKFYKRNGQLRSGNKSMQTKLMKTLGGIVESYKEYMTTEKEDKW